MFDVSFSELFVIAVVALLVIGPEKLPKVARTMGAFMGRMQRYVAQVKEEVNREVRFEELQKLQSEIKQSVKQEKDALQAIVDAPSKPVKTIKSIAKKRVKSPKV
jgi:sec-independent protein translocase protein TatB